eukprot:2753792-Pleurochrysis_carterae.AAC.1
MATKGAFTEDARGGARLAVLQYLFDCLTLQNTVTVEGFNACSIEVAPSTFVLATQVCTDVCY